MLIPFSQTTSTCFTPNHLKISDESVVGAFKMRDICLRIQRYLEIENKPKWNRRKNTSTSKKMGRFDARILSNTNSLNSEQTWSPPIKQQMYDWTVKDEASQLQGPIRDNQSLMKKGQKRSLKKLLLKKQKMKIMNSRGFLVSPERNAFAKSPPNYGP